MQTRPLLRHICYSRSAFEKCAAGKLNALWKYISKFLRDWTFVLQVFKRIKLRNFSHFYFSLWMHGKKKLKYQNLFGKHPFRYWKENFNNIFFCFVIAEPFQNGPFFSFFLVFHSFFSLCSSVFCSYFYFNPSTRLFVCFTRMSRSFKVPQIENRLVKKKTAKSYSVRFSAQTIRYTHARAHTHIPSDWTIDIDLLKYLADVNSESMEYLL